MFSSVLELERFRLAAYATPTFEKRRSTAADDAGHPKYCRAITSKFGTLKRHLDMLGLEGKALGHDLCVRLLRFRRQSQHQRRSVV